MSLRDLRDALPPYAADLRENVQALEDDRTLSPPERWGCVLACALAAGEPILLRHANAAAREPLGERGVEAVRVAFAVTAMNDIYYGVVAGLRQQDYATLPSGLRMEALAHPGADRESFELWCFAVSALDGCTACMDAQDEELRSRGVPAARMQAAIRIAAVLGAVARVLRAEAAMGAAAASSDKAPSPCDGEDAAAPPSPPPGG